MVNDTKKRRARIDMWHPCDSKDFDEVYKYHGAELHSYYCMLCKLQWDKRAPLPNDDDTLSRLLMITKPAWLKAKERLSPYFVVTDTEWYSIFIRDELHTSMNKSHKNAISAKKRHIENTILSITGGVVLPKMDDISMQLARESIVNDWSHDKESSEIKGAIRPSKVSAV